MLIQELQAAPAAEAVLTIADLFAVIFSGVTLVVVIGAAMKLQATLTALTIHAASLKDVPKEMGLMDARVKLIEKDVHNLWQAFRDYMETNKDDENRYIKFLRDWDAKRIDPPDKEK